MKPKITTLVEYMYNFNTSKAPASTIHNIRRAGELLRNLNFIYPVRCRHLSHNRGTLTNTRKLELAVIHTTTPSSNEQSKLLGFVTRMILEL